ncbi:MAG: sigma 54-interacting transcriptional regulator [Burkholderiales bacterium]|nr:sigma 54-interacting transcriptional regulator [Phycisphaerae bacterium]
MNFNLPPADGAHAPKVDEGPPDALLVGASPMIGSIKDVAMSISSRRTTVLIQGETGTGKEMLARHIHSISDRHSNPFVAVDCSALTDTLFESQLFGHVRGAFTGAIRDSIGFIRAADTGTLFLDEIGELPLALQVKLLRVIQERLVIPVGDTRSYPVDVRLLCATNRDIATMVAAGTFRQDLFFRINVITMHVPPLRDRPTDIIPLAQHFLLQQAAVYGEAPKRIAQCAREMLLAYSWPGNVRELANAIEHAHVLATTQDILSDNLPKRMFSATGVQQTPSDLRLDEVERRTIAEALRRTKGNKAAAARMLGLNIQRLNRHIHKLSVRTTRVELPG